METKKTKKSHKVDTEVTSAFALIQNLVSPSLEHNCVLKSTSKMNFARWSKQQKQTKKCNSQNTNATPTDEYSTTNKIVPTEAISNTAASFANSMNFTHGLLQGQFGHNLVLKSVIKNHLFPKVKFINKHHDLAFNQEVGSICYSIFQWCDSLQESVLDKYQFWTSNLSNIQTLHSQHRNNVIKRIRNISNGKQCMSVIVDDILL